MDIAQINMLGYDHDINSKLHAKDNKVDPLTLQT